MIGVVFVVGLSLAGTYGETTTTAAPEDGCPDGDTFVIPSRNPGDEEDYSYCRNLKTIVFAFGSSPFWAESSIPRHIETLILEGNAPERIKEGEETIPARVEGFQNFYIGELIIRDTGIIIAHDTFVGVTGLDEVHVPASCFFQPNPGSIYAVDANMGPFSSSSVRRIVFSPKKTSTDIMPMIPPNFCRDCKALKVVEILGRMMIGDHAFRESSVELLIISEGSNIGASAFKGCFLLDHVVIPEGCQISPTAFSGLNRMASLRVAKNVYKLEEVEIYDGVNDEVNDYNYQLADSSSMQEIDIPDTFDLSNSACGVYSPDNSLYHLPFTMAACEPGKEFEPPSADEVLGNNHVVEKTNTEPYLITIIALGSALGVMVIGVFFVTLRRTVYTGLSQSEI